MAARSKTSSMVAAASAVACTTGALSMSSGLMQGFSLPQQVQNAGAQRQARSDSRATTASAQQQQPALLASASSFSSSSVAVLAGLVVAAGSAAASSSSSSAKKKVAALRAFENELGVQAPVGFWDPIGFTADGDVAAFKRRRATELKHGRISMLACMGYMTPEIIGKFPGYLSPSMGLKYADVPNGLGAISKVPWEGWFQMVFYCLFVEYKSGFGKDWKEGTPGDLGWKMLTAADPAEKQRKLQAEIANSRLAMTAIMAMFFQNGTVGTTGPEMWIGKAPVPGSAWAFENELGVQAPVGFWDPIGFTADGDVAAFKRRRATELKHGRISMLACMGYMTPEIIGKFPGYLSPSMGLKYADIPNGLGAISKVPWEGWFQMVFYCLFVEYKSGFGKDYKEGTPGDLGWKMLTAADPAEKQRKLQAEIANSRLAMTAIMAMFFQNGTVGTTGPEMWIGKAPVPGSAWAFENELGVQAPVGFWDPIGFTADGDVEAFKRRRATELKHGRISMLACMGYMTPEIIGKFPGYLSPSMGLKYADVPNGLGAISKVPWEGWFQMVFYCLFVEYKSGFGKDWKEGTPGDLGWKMLTAADPAEKQRKLQAEIANSRLAMTAIMAMFFQNGTVGTTGPEMWIGKAPVPGSAWAFENELGVQAPVGFWDPIGFTADGDVEAFKRRRATELKHGRISMLACMGYMTPEIIGKFPGYLSPSMGLKYADVPNGLGAISKVPWEGWFQMVFYCLFVEYKSGFGKDWKEGTPGDLGWKMLTAADPAEKQRKLQAEIANSRLAMTAIMAMFFQNGTVGTTGPEMWIGKAPVPGSAW